MVGSLILKRRYIDMNNEMTLENNQSLTDLELFTTIGLANHITADTVEAVEALRKLKDDPDMLLSVLQDINTAAGIMNQKYRDAIDNLKAGREVPVTPDENPAWVLPAEVCIEIGVEFGSAIDIEKATSGLVAGGNMLVGLAEGILVI